MNNNLINKKLFKNIFKSWNFIRIIRLAIGIFFVVEAIKSGMWFLAFVGVIFVAMPLFNFGCCVTGNCSVPTRKCRKTIEVEYE